MSISISRLKNSPDILRSAVEAVLCQNCTHLHCSPKPPSRAPQQTQVATLKAWKSGNGTLLILTAALTPSLAHMGYLDPSRSSIYITYYTVGATWRINVAIGTFGSRLASRVKREKISFPPQCTSLFWVFGEEEAVWSSQMRRGGASPRGLGKVRIPGSISLGGKGELRMSPEPTWLEGLQREAWGAALGAEQGESLLWSGARPVPKLEHCLLVIPETPPQGRLRAP